MFQSPEFGAQGFSIIPTRCPKFLAACATVGIELQPGSPGISNVYSRDRKYDPEEPGEISYHLGNTTRNPLAVAKVWLSPDQEIAEAEALPGRFASCPPGDPWQKLIEDVENLHVSAAVAMMRKFSDGKFPIDGRSVSDEEEQAAKYLSGLSAAMTRDGHKCRQKAGVKLAAAWNPAMFAWVKAWIANYLELRESWKAANPAIKIDREGRFPLIIPKGKHFGPMMKRWVS